jgi:hypothetical protein
MRRSAWVWVLTLGTVLAAAAAHTDTEKQRHTLVGLQSVHLELALRGDDLEAFGLNELVLRPEIESKLTAAGLRLLDVDASAHTPGVPWLFVNISVLKSPGAKDYAWSMRLQLQQRACLERDPSVCESVGSWETDRIGSVGRRRVKTQRDDVSDLVNQFTSAWLAANPR